MKAVQIVAITLTIGIVSLTVCPTADFSGPRIAHAEETWQKEFEAVCSLTNDAMELTKDEVKNLVDRCDKLKPIIQKLDETQRKVYLKRLESCRAFLMFVLESNEKK